MPELTLRYGANSYDLETFSEKDHIHQQIATTGTFYELPVLRWIHGRGRRGAYVDVGANIGNHSVWFLNECYSSEVISIEGNLAVIPILQRNIRRNLPDEKLFTVVESFISCHPEVVFCPWGEDNVGMSSVRLAVLSQTSDILQQARTLDSILQDIKSICFVKIDVEGHEMEVLRSGMQVFRKWKPDLLIECWQDQNELCEWLRNLGYVQLYGDYEANHGFVFAGHFLAKLDHILAVCQKRWKKRFRDRFAQVLAKFL